MVSDILLSLKTEVAKDSAESVLNQGGRKFYYKELSDNIFRQIDNIQPNLAIIEVDNNNFIQKINIEIIRSRSLPFYPLILLIHEQLTIPLSVVDASDNGHLTIIQIPCNASELYNRVNIYLNFPVAQSPKKKPSIAQNSFKTVFNTFFENLNEMVFITEKNQCKIIYANKKFNDIVGYGTVNKICWEVLANKTNGQCDHCKLFNIEKRTHNQIIFYQKINRWYSIDEFLSPWFDKKTVRFHIGTDITSLKKTQNQLNLAKIKAEKAMQLKDQFVSLVAHDLKSPFVSIMADLELLELRKKNISENELKSIFERVMNNGNRAVKLINILLNLNRLKTGSIRLEYKIIDVTRMIDSIINELSTIASSKSVKIDNQIPERFWMFADASLFGEVIYNIINNAIKFSHTDSKIEITCLDDNLPGIIVKDFGIGINEDTRKKLFSSEFITSRPGTKGEKGTGLGINYCHDIMKAHSGDIHIDSKLDEGTSVSLRFPHLKLKIIIITDEILDQKQYDVLSHYKINFINVESRELNSLKNYLGDISVCAIIYNLEDYGSKKLQKIAELNKPVFLIEKDNKSCAINTKDYPKLMCISAATLNSALKNILIW